MRFFKKKYSLPASRRRWLADLGVAIQRVAFVASLWSLLLDALSPNTKIFIPPIVIHPLLFLSFTPAPPPPSETARAIESSRDEELEPQPGPSNAAFFVCLAVAHTITLHVLSTQREPAVNNECGIEESLYTFPIPESPSDEEALRKLAECGRGIEESSEITTTPIHTSPSDDEALRKLAKYGCGIEESSDVTTTPISTSTSDQANIETNDNEHEHDDPPIVQNTKENANTSVINIQDVKNTLGLVLLYALAAAEKMNNPRLHALVKRIRWHHAQRATPEPTTPKSTLDIIATSTQIEVVTESSWHDTHCATPEPTTPESTLDIISTSTQNEEVTESIEEAEKAESEDEKDSTSEKLEEESDGDVEVRVDVEEVKEVSDEEINANTNKSEEVDVNVEEVTATADESKDIQIAAATEYRWDEDTDDSDDEWFTICKGKVIKTSTLSGSSLPPVAAPTSSITEEETDTTTSPSTVVAPAFIESVAEVSTVEPQHAIIQTCSKEKEWHTVRRAEKLPAFPPEPQAPSMSHNRCRIVPAKNPNWLEEKAERNRREMEAWKAFKEAEKEAERVRVEEEERRAREVKKARAAHMANFDTAMGRLDELLKGAREAREKWEKEKEENEKTLKGIDVAQGRIGELVDLEKVRDLFDPRVLGSSSLFSTATQLRIPSGHKIPEAPPKTTALPEQSDTSSDETAASPDVESSLPVSAIVEVTALPSVKISETTPSSALPMSYASAAGTTAFQSNAAERTVALTAEEREERRKRAQNKATVERRKRRKNCHARWLAQQAEAGNGESGEAKPGEGTQNETGLEDGLKADPKRC